MPQTTLPQPLDPAWIAAQKAKRIGPDTGRGEQLFGPKGKILDFITDIAIPKDPTPLDVALMGAGLMSPLVAKLGLSKFLKEAPGLAPIASDPYALAEGPIARRQFLYKASGVPNRAAAARAKLSPQVLESVVTQLQGMPKFPIAARGQVLGKLTKEKTLLEALHDRYGVLNESIRPDPYPSPDRFNPNSLWASGYDVIPGTDKWQKLKDILSAGTERKYRDAIKTILRTRPREIVKDKETYVQARDAFPDLMDEVSQLHDEGSERADDLFRSADPSDLQDNAGIGDALSEIWRNHRAKQTALYNKIHQRILSGRTFVPAPDDPVGYDIPLAFDDLAHTLKVNLDTDYAARRIREKLAPIGGIPGKVARDAAEALIAAHKSGKDVTGISAIEDTASETQKAIKSTVESVLNRFNFKPVSSHAVEPELPGAPVKSEILTTLEKLSSRRAAIAAQQPADPLLDRMRKLFGGK